MLVAEGLDVSYGSARALFDVGLSVAPGQTLAIVGSNGAGKSTLARTLSGLIRPARGTVRFKGNVISRSAPAVIRRLGLSYLPETRAVFRELSVVDNLRMSAWPLGSRAERSRAIERAFEMFPVLAERRRQIAGTLSGGEQQMLALARGLAVGSDLVIADELSLGLAPIMVDEVFASFAAAKELGLTMVVIEQFTHRALQIADTCLILSRGSVMWTGEAADASVEVINRYLGVAGNPPAADEHPHQRVADRRND
jgi:branched-chain amino acid transport system ATP-binding protein